MPALVCSVDAAIAPPIYCLAGYNCLPVQEPFSGDPPSTKTLYHLYQNCHGDRSSNIISQRTATMSSSDKLSFPLRDSKTSTNHGSFGCVGLHALI